MKTQAFFVDIGEGQGVYICSPENGGNSFYIAPLSDTLADNSKSAHQPTHLGPIQWLVFKAFKRRSHGGIIRFDLHSQKWVSNCVEMHRGTPAAKIGLICNALEAKQSCYFKAFRLRLIGGQYDLTCTHQSGPLMAYRWAQRSQDGRPTPRRSHPGSFCDLQSCAVTQEGCGPLAAPAESVHPLRVCTLPAGQITSMITPAAI